MHLLALRRRPRLQPFDRIEDSLPGLGGGHVCLVWQLVGTLRGAVPCVNMASFASEHLPACGVDFNAAFAKAIRVDVVVAPSRLTEGGATSSSKSGGEPTCENLLYPLSPAHWS